MARAESPSFYFHVSPSVNRDSILRFGLDWKRMGANERGIANGWPGKPEIDGIFLTDANTDDASFFVRFGHGRQIDVWRADVAGLPIEPGPDGWWVCRAAIPARCVELIEVWETDAEEAFGEPSPLPLPPAHRRGS